MKKSIVLILALMFVTGCSVGLDYKPLYEVKPVKTQFEEKI